MYRYVLFDLDGTLTDPQEGITACVQHALAAFGIDEAANQLTHFIGPPLHRSFMECYGFTDAEATEAVRVYRERFGTLGIFENRVYEGVPELLEKLAEAGIVVAVATSKPEPYAVRILDHFDLARHFDVVTGSNMDGSRTDKGDVIREALTRLGQPNKRDVVMVGDRKHDVEGARREGIDAIGVTWGYAPEGELEAAEPTRLASSLSDLYDLLLDSNGRSKSEGKGRFS